MYTLPIDSLFECVITLKTWVSAAMHPNSTQHNFFVLYYIIVVIIIIIIKSQWFDQHCKREFSFHWNPNAYMRWTNCLFAFVRFVLGMKKNICFTVISVYFGLGFCLFRFFVHFQLYRFRWDLFCRKFNKFKKFFRLHLLFIGGVSFYIFITNSNFSDWTHSHTYYATPKHCSYVQIIVVFPG